MDNTERKGFRKAFMGGFSKKDVISYIEEATNRYASRIEELEERLLAAENEKAATASSLSAAEEKITELEKSREEFARVSEKLADLTEKHEALSASFDSKEAEAKTLSEEKNQMSEKISSLSLIEAEYAAKKTELADIEISARSRANEILAEAEREISAKKAAFDAELSARERRFEEERERSLREANDTVASMMRVVDSLRAEVESMDSRLVRITDGARNNLSTLSNSVSDAGDKISRLSDALNKF